MQILTKFVKYIRVFIDCEAVLTNTHNLCFGAKIRKIGIPLHTPVLLYKSGFEGVYISRTCFPDGLTLKLVDGNVEYSSIPKALTTTINMHVKYTTFTDYISVQCMMYMYIPITSHFKPKCTGADF